MGISVCGTITHHTQLSDDGNTVDYTSWHFERYRFRFKDDQHKRKHLPKAVKPSRAIQIVNIPAWVTADHIKNYLEGDCSIQVFGIVAVRRRAGQADDKSPEGPEFDRYIVVSVDFDTIVLAMAKLPGKYATGNDIGLKCFFTKETAPKLLKKISEARLGQEAANWEIIPNNQIIPPYP